jgi:glycosyltransferase involved in cell wall biosynthesis
MQVTEHIDEPRPACLYLLNFETEPHFMVCGHRGHSRCDADSRVPCGHVTLVSAMHLGKAIISTESAPLLDYIKLGINAWTYPARDDAALAQAMQAMHDDPEISRRLQVAGQLFARTHSVEKRVIEYFREFLRAGRLHDT